MKPHNQTVTPRKEGPFRNKISERMGWAGLTIMAPLGIVGTFMGLGSLGLF